MHRGATTAGLARERLRRQSMGMIRLVVVGGLARHAAAFATAAQKPLPPKQIILPVNELHPAMLKADDLMRSCEIKHTKGSGPGGQHRNKVQTAIVVTHTPTSLTGSASESRSQQSNLGNAIFRLRLRLALKCRTGVVAADDGVLPSVEPSALWASRTQGGGKLAMNANHADFPSILAEALDCIWWQGEVKAASEALGVSTSQMVKLLAKEPAALQLTNGLRASNGLPPLRPNK